jgi:hypothetical protein
MPCYLQLGQDGISSGDGDTAWVWLVLSVGDLAVLVDNHGPATVAIAHASGPTVVLGEERFGVAEEQLWCI